MKAKFLAIGLCAVMATTAVFADDTSTSAATPAMSGSTAPATSGTAAPAPSAPTSGNGQVSQ